MTSQMAGRKHSISLASIFIYLVLAVFVILFLFPVLWLMITSLKPQSDIYNASLPNPPTLASYASVMLEYAFDKYFVNSIIVASVTTGLVAVVSVMGAYGFSKYKYPVSPAIFLVCVLLRMIPFITLMLPLYIYISRLGIMNTKLALIVADTTFNLPMALWILESFFRGFPDELIEAAQIDGASRWGTLLKVVVPVTVPSISTVVILTFLNAWNEFMFAFVTSSSDSAKTLTVGIAMLTQQYGVRWDLMTAAGTLYIVPTLLIAICFQKYIISGLTLGAVKG